MDIFINILRNHGFDINVNKLFDTIELNKKFNINKQTYEYSTLPFIVFFARMMFGTTSKCALIREQSTYTNRKLSNENFIEYSELLNNPLLKAIYDDFYRLIS